MDARGRKNAAGLWLLQRALVRVVFAMMGALGLMGFSLGLWVRGVPMVDRVAGELAAGSFIAVAVATVFLLFIVRKDSTWARGLAAERRVGDRIEHALVRDGCAFAHDVKEALGPGGNVGHVVLTPAGVWVVETKAAWLGKGRFKKALRQVSGNVRRVRERLETPLPVRGALVIADDTKPYESDFDWQGEPIKAFRLVSFWRRVREECDGDAVASPRELEALARKVWGLGSIRHLEA